MTTSWTNRSEPSSTWDYRYYAGIVWDDVNETWDQTTNTWDAEAPQSWTGRTKPSSSWSGRTEPTTAWTGNSDTSTSWVNRSEVTDTSWTDRTTPSNTWKKRYSQGITWDEYDEIWDRAFITWDGTYITTWTNRTEGEATWTIDRATVFLSQEDHNLILLEDGFKILLQYEGTDGWTNRTEPAISWTNRTRP